MVSQAYAGFWRRFIAYLIDVVPITVAALAVAYFFLDFDALFHRYLETGPSDQDLRAEFIEGRNAIRNGALIAYLAYSGILNASPFEGTVGKRLLGMRVKDAKGQRITLARSALRSVSVMMSLLPVFLGFLAALWSKTNQTWHDWAAGTYVVLDPPRARQPKNPYRLQG